MANYGLYSNIDPASLTSAASSIKEEINSKATSVSNLNNSLNDSIWKCNAKSSLKEGLTKISGEVNTQIASSIEKLITVAEYITSYKEAEKNALSIKNSLSSTPNTEENAGTIASLKSDLVLAEKEMDNNESKVRGMM